MRESRPVQAGLVQTPKKQTPDDDRRTAAKERPVRLASHEDNKLASTEDMEWSVNDDADLFPLDEPATGLSLDDFQHLALASSPTIQHSAARIAIAQGQHVQAGLYPNPTIGYHGMNIGSRGTAGRQAGFFQQRIVTGGKLALDQEIACREIEAQQALLTAAQQRVLTDVRRRFYEALVAQRRLELTNELLDVVSELAQSTQKLLDGGQTSENALLQAEIEVEQAQIVKNNTSHEFEEAWRQLCVVAGNPDLPQSRLQGDFGGAFTDLDFDVISDRIISSHPQLIAAQARIERANVTIARAEREVVPDLMVLVDAARTNQTRSNTFQARVGVEIPLWDKNQGNILSAQGELASARAEQRRLELQLQQQLATVFRQYANALHQATRYRDSILPKAERSLELVREGYDNGQVEYLTLLNSQQKFVQVNLAYTDALEDLQRAAALIDGQLLEGSLASD